MNAEQESAYYRHEVENYERSLRLRGVNPHPANKTSYSMDGKTVTEKEWEKHFKQDDKYGKGKKMNNEIIRNLITNAMNALCNLPCSEIGPNGASQADLDAMAAEGRYADDDAVYDMGQRTWLMLEEARKMIK